jgi:hypothetical protein
VVPRKEDTINRKTKNEPIERLVAGGLPKSSTSLVFCPNQTTSGSVAFTVDDQYYASLKVSSQPPTRQNRSMSHHKSEHDLIEMENQTISWGTDCNEVNETKMWLKWTMKI